MSLTRREALKEILEYLRRKKIKEPVESHRSEDFEDEPGLDKNGIVIRPPERKKAVNPLNVILRDLEKERP